MKFKKLIVHSGVFHADDVAVAALMQIWAARDEQRLEIVRTHEVSGEDANADDVLVADIGGGEYDHHDGRKRHADGTAYAAIGLFWRDFGGYLVPTQRDWADFNSRYVRPIEAQDTTGYLRNPLSEAVSAMNPAWDSEESSDEAFAKAVAFMRMVFEAVFAKYWARARARTIACQSPVKNGVLLTKRFLPVAAGAVEGARFHAYPCSRTPGAWNVKVLNKNHDVLPATPEATFRHKAGFIAEFKDRETLDRWIGTF